MLLGWGREERGYYLGGKLYGFSCLTQSPCSKYFTKEKKLEKYVNCRVIQVIKEPLMKNVNF
jgi:hypothetical protein